MTLLATILAAVSPSVSAVHGDDLLTCDLKGAATDWSDHKRLGELIEGLRGLHHDGLNPDGYPLRELSSAMEHLALWGSLSDCENQLAEQTYHQALLDLSIGRVDPLVHGIVWQSPLIPTVNPDKVLVCLNKSSSYYSAYRKDERLMQ
ncbi:MAG: hypothetical protein ABJM11_12060 [Marinobacter sp.]|uniref:hypothetical protein n=1 Tax=Marinobacter sp. TaxID=50741 RepID=UPI00329A2B61